MGEERRRMKGTDGEEEGDKEREKRNNKGGKVGGEERLGKKERGN